MKRQQHDAKVTILKNKTKFNYFFILFKCMICIYWSEGKCMYKPPAVPQKARSLPFWSPPKIFLQFALKKKTNIIFFVGPPLISGPQKFRVWTAPSLDWWGCQNFTNIECLMWVMRCVMIWRGQNYIIIIIIIFFKNICPLCSHRNKSWEWGQTNQTGGREDWSLVWFLVYWQPM